MNERYTLTASEIQLLTETCRSLDLADSLQAAIRRDGVMTAATVHPAIGKLVALRLSLLRQLDALRLPVAKGSKPLSIRGVRAQKAANRRWQLQAAIKEMHQNG